MSCKVRLTSGNMRNALNPLLVPPAGDTAARGGGHKRPPPPVIFQSSNAFNLFRQTADGTTRGPGACHRPFRGTRRRNKRNWVSTRRV